MKNGNKISEWKYYYYSGELRYIHKYDNQGKRIGSWIEISKEGDTMNIKKYQSQI